MWNEKKADENGNVEKYKITSIFIDATCDWWKFESKPVVIKTYNELFCKRVTAGPRFYCRCERKEEEAGKSNISGWYGSAQ